MNETRSERREPLDQRAKAKADTRHTKILKISMVFSAIICYFRERKIMALAVWIKQPKKSLKQSNHRTAIIAIQLIIGFILNLKKHLTLKNV